MYKKIIFSLLLPFFLITQPVSMPSIFKSTPENTVVVVELHRVFMSYTRLNFFYALSKLMMNADNKLELSKLYFNSAFWLDVDRLFREKKISEEVIAELCRLYPQLASHEGDIQTIAVIDRWQPSADVIEIIKNLKKKGYAVYGIGDMGLVSFHIAAQKYKQEFELFDGFYIAADAENKTLNNPDFYTSLRNEKLNIDGHQAQQALVFVSKNDMFIAAMKSTTADVISVKFNSLDQFKAELQRRGLLK